MHKFKYVFLAFALFFTSTMFFGCEEKQKETAICKLNGTQYESLAKAISVSQDGDTIKVYNDCLENVENLVNLGISFKVIDNAVYSEYVINKNITIEGVGSDKPVIFGNFTTELNDKYNSYDKITISNLEIIHAETDNDYNHGIYVIDGSVKIFNNYIHFAGTESKKNSYGVLLTRKNGNFENSQNSRKLNYNVVQNKFGVYASSLNENLNSGIAVFENGDNYGAMTENVFNNSKEKPEKIFLKDNQFEGGNLVYHKSLLNSVALGLVTRDLNCMQIQVDDKGVLIFDGNLIYSELTAINLYCETIIKGYVKNVNFFGKSLKAKVSYEKTNSSNVTYKPVTEIK